MLRPAPVLVCVSCALLTAFVGSAAAQQLPQGVEPRKFENNVRAIQSLVKDLSKGDKKMDDPAAADAVDLLAKSYAFPVTWQENQSREGRMFFLIELFDRDLGSYVRSLPNNQAFVDALVKQFLVHIGEVMKNDRIIARVNGARLLQVLAKYGFTDAAEPLLEALKEKDQSDGVRYWIYQGLGETLGQMTKSGPVPPKNKPREVAIVTALIEAVERKVTLPVGSLPEEEAGVRRLRREAVKALAEARCPVLLDAGKQVKAQTALVLLRVLRRDGTVPPAQWDEQMEAAVGLARMQCKLYEPYQPDYVAHHIGLFVVEYANHYVNGMTEERGWKVRSLRLADALTGYGGMQSDVAKNRAKEKETTAYVTKACEDAVKVLLKVDGKATANPADYANWLSSNPPPHETVYRGVPESKVKPPADTGE